MIGTGLQKKTLADSQFFHGTRNFAEFGLAINIISVKNVEVSAQRFDNVLLLSVIPDDAAAYKRLDTVAQRPANVARLAVNGVKCAIDAGDENKGEHLDVKLFFCLFKD